MNSEIKRIIQQHYDRDSDVTEWEQEAEKYIENIRQGNERFGFGAYVRDKDRILDIGTGGGRFALGIALGMGVETYGIDLSSNLLKSAKRKAEELRIKVNFFQADAENLPFKNETFDLIVCMAALPCFPNPKKALLEMSRATKSGGYIRLNMINTLSLRRFCDLHLYFYHYLAKKPLTNKSLTIWQLKRYLKYAGLEIVKIEGEKLVAPQLRIQISKGNSIPLLPESFTHWFLKNVEKRFKLGQSFLKNFMYELDVWLLNH